MALLEEWHKIAYNDKADQGELQRFWQHYFLLEKGVYEKLLANPDEAVEGTVRLLRRNQCQPCHTKPNRGDG